MLRELQDRYGSWAGHALLPAVGGKAWIEWPNKGSFESDVGLYVGPDAARWLWCKAPPGASNLPKDFRVEGVKVVGTTADGRSFNFPSCAPSSLSMLWAAGAGATTDVLLRIEDQDMTLPDGAAITGPCEARWVLTNAVFNGEEMSPDPAAGPNMQRRDLLKFRSPSREWTLRLLPTFRDAERTALLNGVVKQLPTAELVTTIADTSEIPAAENDAYAVTRLLSMATGGSVAGGCRRIYQNGLVAETFFEWPMYGGAESVSFAGHIANDGMLGFALTRFLNETVAKYLADDPALGFTNVIGYLEQARTSQLVEAKIVLSILALESLTYRLCLRLGRTAEQLEKTNIQQKLNTIRGQLRMGFIDKRFADDARESVRNPLMHSGVIPTLSMPEKVQWSDDLYALAFRMMLFLLGYKGKWYDPNNRGMPTDAPA